ncbi:MAG: methyltransferase domain-containing protein [Clostridia bacterium]|nr:methyltransferase domain-containing protein [Clostridia bacterium]
MANSYSALGRWFEYLNEDCGYEQWSQYLIERLKNLGAGPRGVDIGCGNGYFTRALIKAGYSAVGVDISPQMLDKAQQLSLKEGVRAEFLLSDITKLKLNFKADFAVAVNDCLNYVSKDKIKTAFSRVYSCLKKGGVFIFDISSPNKLKNIIGNNLFAEDNDDLTYLWFNKLDGDRVVMDLTFFERQGEKYLRSDERHIQYIHEEDGICAALKEVGFAVRTEGHLGKDKTERINFICTRL